MISKNRKAIYSNTNKKYNIALITPEHTFNNCP